jgi:ABC-2 type transport system ATP-binding protein
VSALPVRLRAVEKRYPGTPPIVAVAGIDLEVEPRSIIGLLGPNGAGKSTTIGMITTRVRPTGGVVEVFGVDAVRQPARVKSTLGVVPQANTLDRSLDLFENLYYHCRYFGMDARSSRRRADELLERFLLADRRHAMPQAISGGMAQRLQIARAVAHGPSLLLLDEPTAGLDPQSRIALWDLVRELREDGMTVLLSTHYMEEADELCERVAIIDHGRILVDDTPASLKERYGAGVRIDLRLSASAPEGLVRTLETLGGVVGVDVDHDGLADTLRVAADRSDGLVADVVAAVVASGSSLRDLSVTAATLEAVFIGLTGRDLRE